LDVSNCLRTDRSNFNFTPHLALPFYHNSRTNIMETYWCCKDNSIIDNYLKPDHNPALVPCIQEKCPRWKKRGRPWRVHSSHKCREASQAVNYTPNDEPYIRVRWKITDWCTFVSKNNRLIKIFFLLPKRIDP
jgi:hypothetical protein